MSGVKRQRTRRRADRVWAWLRVAAFIGLCAATALTAKRIEDSRQQVIIRACEEQNVRHDRTIEEFDTQVALLPPGRRLERALNGRAATVALIDALAPVRDCDERLEQLTR